jgi:hypothetical protein
MNDKELLDAMDYSEKFSSILNPSWPAETFDPYSFYLFLTYASPEELEQNYCSEKPGKKFKTLQKSSHSIEETILF